MQPHDSLGITRRAMDVEDYIDVVRRHRAWILGPLFAALVVSVVVAFLWPDTYVSTAIIRVVPPQVPEIYVPSNITTDMQSRVNSMEQTILSRATLTNLITTQGLYLKERSRKPMDDVIEDMRTKDIKISNIQLLSTTQAKQNYPAFSISFSYNNRFTAKKVAEDLVARFLEENQKQVTTQTGATTGFITDRHTEAKQKLDEIESRLSAFRSRNLGRLPEEQATNFAHLNAAQSQMFNISTEMARNNQEKLLLENNLRTYKDELATMKDPVNQSTVLQQKNEKLAEKDREIQGLEQYLTNLREHYKDTYPDVQTAVTRLATAKKQREAIVKEDAGKKPEVAAVPQASPVFVRESRDMEAAIKQVAAQIETKDMQSEELRKQAAQVQEGIRSLQARLESTPVGMKEYDELIRDRELARAEYEKLDRELSSSQGATKLIFRQQGERLDELDPPSLPQTPTEPKRPIIIAIGSAIGLAIGLCLAAAREMKDTSLKNLKDVRAYTQLPVLGSVPLLENDVVVRRRKRLAWLAWSTACLVGVVVMSSSVVYYLSTKV
jgi:polysaccharide chain length determinant protein (PEP-CTERM system associated)